MLKLALALLLCLNARTGASDVCAEDDEGIWSSALVEWATSHSNNNTRQGRILHVPQSNGFYVTERIDRPSAAPPSRATYDEWPRMTPPPPPSPAKIVNRPPNPYKDKVKPTHYIEHRPPQRPASVDRVDEPPRKEVSETDLYLLGAIEKLVYRVDLMEKRLRRMEESVHTLVAAGGTHDQHKQPPAEPCSASFARIAGGCYHFSREQLDWKSGNLACRKMKAHLLEMETEQEKRQLIAVIQAEETLRGGDYWTGGLNPGLLWIWSNSARPVLSNSTTGNGTQSSTMSHISGEGRCLSVDYDPAVRAYMYRGEDCAIKHRYICEQPEDAHKLSNEIERVAKNLRTGNAIILNHE